MDGSDFSCGVLPFVQSFLDPAQTEVVLLKIVTREPNGVANRSEPLRAANAFASQANMGSDDRQLAHRFIYASQEWDSAVADAKATLSPMVKQLRDAGFEAKSEVKFGHDVAHSIASFVSTGAADMVAMSTHNRSGLSRMVRGSVAEEVMRRVKVPVIMMHPAKAA
jgi:nucleotide-binding universal stress UspA family protein